MSQNEVYATWERRPAPPPASYWTTDGRWAILPETGGHTWELCTVDAGGGLTLWQFCDTVHDAKQEVERIYQLEARRVS